ncbi:hypothetical protein B0H66DRAFT_598233 [Apodospora peruviana]|uniref:Aminoglycoside phosphotransferase domain-containing protein n=1 Tax=Apodospora peruviana TaxID=516989 RepID=A0AAE0MGC7_9PEZI|nr:hypothetical protein B0H66DRAFT_598233 [Apodospora peruviana]
MHHCSRAWQQDSAYPSIIIKQFNSSVVGRDSVQTTGKKRRYQEVEEPDQSQPASSNYGVPSVLAVSTTRFLQIFGPAGPLSSLTEESESCVKVPHAVLVSHHLSLLGLEYPSPPDDPRVTLCDVFEAFLNLETSGVQATTDSGLSAANVPALRMRCGQIGARLGRFFACLHGPRRFCSDELPEGLPEDILSSMKQIDFERTEPFLGEACLAKGDLHPGPVLITPPRRKLWLDRDGIYVEVIDWELTNISNPVHGRGANGDMAQFLASLHLLFRWGSIFNGDVETAVQKFAADMGRGYNKVSPLADPFRELLRKDALAVRKSIDKMPILRSAFLVMGREIIS